MSFEQLSTKYLGQTAEQYDRVRAGKKWESEQRATEQLLEYVAEGSAVLDIPVGTGRLFPFFTARNFHVCAMDVSPDMLDQARAAAHLTPGDIRFEMGDIRAIPYADGSFDLVTCVRFLNLVDSDGLEVVLAELARVSGDMLMIGIRYVTPLSDFVARPSNLLRLPARPVRLARRIGRGVLGARSDVRAHDRRAILRLLDRLGLDIFQERCVERRWDNTDYVMWLLQKRTTKT